MDYAKAADAAGCNLANDAANEDAHQNVICSDSYPLTDTTGLFVTESPCQKVYDMAVSLAQNIYRERRDSLLNDFETAYRALCLSAGDREQFTVNYLTSEYHYTLYYYDMAGNLVKTVPPKGVHPAFRTSFTDSVKAARQNNNFLPRPHELTTDYRYNSLNALVAQHTPDGGTSHFWYDHLGRLVVSQNAQQQLDNRYSYTVYDAFGRITEVGQKPQTTAMSQVISQDDGDLEDWIETEGGTKEQMTITDYDFPSVMQGTYFTQKNLRNRISRTGIKKTDDYDLESTYYTYDIHGNVDTLLQDYHDLEDMVDSDNRFKLIAYAYDLISGKVNAVNYQPGRPDAFYHRYQYDAENRLICVETSHDSLVWEPDARYSYYKHGPLARMILGQQQVQGVDYAYTLQGWLKGTNPVFGGSSSGEAGGGCMPGTAEDNLVVNSRDANGPAQYLARNSIEFGVGFESTANDQFETILNPDLGSCEPGGGGDNGSSLPFAVEGNPVAKDAYGLSLHYYQRDYKAIGSTAASAGILGALSTSGASLYNGNIAAMAVNLPQLGTAKVYAYHYDQLNRLKEMNAYNGLNIATGSFTPVSLDDYREKIVYDPNGNITAYNRNGTGNSEEEAQMDALAYQYDAGTNRLNYINDTILPRTNGKDINAQNADNYTYDAIGNLKTDVAEGITSISWSIYGKITSIAKGSTIINYTYDAAGNRTSKTAGGNLTVYVRDASGNVMSIYEKPSGSPLQQTETWLYGSSRLGLQTMRTVTPESIPLEAGFKPATVSVLTRGEKIFELSNHLGNVLATVTDRKLQHSTDDTLDYYEADIKTATDYYPFGMIMPGRTFQDSSDTYRYGFNGKENDNDVKGEGNQQDYGKRIYDTRIGKFLSVDPLSNNYPELTPYQFASNSPITFIDLDGEENAFKMPDGTLYFQPPSDHLKVPIPTGAIRMDHVTTTSKQEKLEDLSLVLDFTPGIGTIKGLVEGVIGTDMAGNELDAGDRVMGLIPYLGKAKNALKIVKVADKINETEKIIKSVNKIDKAVSAEKAIVYSKKELDALRSKAVREAWQKEKKLVEETGRGSREWTGTELKQLREKGKIDGYHGHHRDPVKGYPEKAGDPDNIDFLKSDNPRGGGAKKKSEHWKAHNPDKST